MPLPSNATLSLQGHSRPGDTVLSKPKQAMIVRMSVEAIEALEGFTSHPKMDFEFGDNPGIYIGENFFPVRPLKESTPHDLYLRTSTAAKPNGPLKLYANVTGKFTVERELGSHIQDKLRNRTLTAEKEREGRKAILLPDPPVLNAPAKKRKPQTTSIFAKKPGQASSSSAFPARVVSPRPPPPPVPAASKEALELYQSKILCSLALKERPLEDLVSRVTEADDSSVRKDVTACVRELCEVSPTKKDDNGVRLWQLKARSWLDVRPYEYEHVTEAERTTMARQARLMLKDLKIPETDPLWNHFRWRNTAAQGKAPATKNDVRRGVSSKEVKDKKAAKIKAETVRAGTGVQMKNESAAPSPARPVASSAGTSTGVKGKEAELRAGGGDVKREGTPQARPAGRRLPGSGFKQSKAPTPVPSPPDPRRPRNPPSLPSKPTPSPAQPAAEERRTASGASAQPRVVKKVKEVPKVVEPERERERVRPREDERERARPRENGEREKERVKPREDGEVKERVRPREDGDREKVRPKERDRDGDRERERNRDRDVDSGERKRDAPSVGVKRKKALRDNDEYGAEDERQKRRKTDPGFLAVPHDKAGQDHEKDKDKAVRDAPLPKKPAVKPEASPLARTKIRKDYSPAPSRPSPAPPPLAKPVPSTSSNSSTSSAPVPVPTHRMGSTGSVKRRRSPVYTSSDSEDDVLPPPKREKKSAAGAGRRARASLPLPTDHAALRARYSESYDEYIETFQQIVAQKRKTEAMLSRRSTDSEGDVELMDIAELERLSAVYKVLKDELESIQQVFS